MKPWQYIFLAWFAMLAYTTAMCYDGEGHQVESPARPGHTPRAEQADRGVMFRPRNEDERNQAIAEVFMAGRGK